MRRLRSDGPAVARCALLVVTVTFAVACGASGEPRAQVVVVIDTDLPVPKANAADEAAREDPPTLVDTARIDLFRAGTMDSACSEPRDCRHDIGLDEEKLKAHLVSFGVVRAREVDVRVRLFRRNRATEDGEPPASAAVERRVRLVDTDPDVSAPVIRQRLLIQAEGWGRLTSADLTAGPIYMKDADGPSQVGTWPGAAIVPCALPPDAADAAMHPAKCIPGGAFYRSDPRITFTGNDFGVIPTRLAIVSPFYFDTYEYTVADYLREGLPKGATPPLTYVPFPVEREEWRVNCALENPSPNVASLALNCVTKATAEALCLARGRRLPTETEFEFAATGRGQERFFPWGNAPPYEPRSDGKLSPCCDSGIFARQTRDEKVSGIVEQNQCSFGTPEPLTGYRTSLAEPVDAVEHATLSAACASKRDISRDGIVGLGGNVSEWLADSFGRADGPCWSGTGILRNPLCVAAPSEPFLETLSGGNVFSAPLGLTGRVRSAPGDQAIIAKTVAAGFRCARDGSVR